MRYAFVGKEDQLNRLGFLKVTNLSCPKCGPPFLDPQDHGFNQ